MESVVSNPVTEFDIEVGWSDLEHPTESQEHRDKKFNVALDHLRNGWQVGIEVTIPELGYIIDVVAESDDTVKAIEVGHVKSEKLDDLRDYFDEVQHEPYFNGTRTVTVDQTSSHKRNVSVSLDDPLLDALDEVPDRSRSEILNEKAWEWVEDNGHGERPS